jgi:hypothetical protein
VLNLPYELQESAANPRRSVAPVIVGMVALAALDIVGAAFARSWADHRSTISLLGGLLAFGLLFVVYGKSLSYAELSTVTIGWVVLLQVGVVALDRLHGVAIPPSKMAAIALILALQAYLTVGDLAG